MYDTEQQRERVVLITIDQDANDAETNANLDELALLVDTAGAQAVGRISQRREAKHPGTYLGKGKIDEVRALCDELDATAVVADDELTAAQQRNLGKLLGVRILDRTLVILDIFAQRARTAEGKAQVELAQLRYRLSHLIGLGAQMTRQGGTAAHGGVGTRGPGEKKLETDRRHIRNRIDQLKQELTDMKNARELLRKKRTKAGMPVLALVGYTNAGKSTLMNAITQAGVLAEDKLFATLDTTTRKTQLPDNGPEVLFTDTVGFIHKLPHHLIQAFRATLEEMRYADILLHVVDCASPRAAEQMAVVYDTLKQLDCLEKPIITVLNKIDQLPADQPPDLRDPRARHSIPLSAHTGQNIDGLHLAIADTMQSMRKHLSILLPYSQGTLTSQVHSQCEVLTTEHQENGTYMQVYAPADLAGRLTPYVIE